MGKHGWAEDLICRNRKEKNRIKAVILGCGKGSTIIRSLEKPLKLIYPEFKGYSRVTCIGRDLKLRKPLYHYFWKPQFIFQTLSAQKNGVCFQ